MKNKLFFSGIIGILLIFAIFVGCETGTNTEVVVVTAPGTPQIIEPPKETVEVPPQGSTYADVAKALIDAEEKYNKDGTKSVIRINGQIPVQGNSSLIVPNHVTLEIVVGARLTIEANALLFVREFGKVIVHGELYFEKNANGDDVRQAKIVGDIDVDGGVVYDKSDDAHLLQYVSKITNGGRLAYGGGTTISGQHEKFFLGTSTFKNEEGSYIKLIFSDGWSKYRPVVITDPKYSLINQPVVTPNPGDPDTPVRLLGFEVYGKVEITGGEMVLPDSVDDITNPDMSGTTDSANPLSFVVKAGSTLTIGSGASLRAEGTIAKFVTQFVVEEGGAVSVSGTLGVPVTQTSTFTPLPVNKNEGTITVNSGGTLLVDPAALNAAWLTGAAGFNKGKITLSGGSTVLYNRAAPTVYLSTGPAATVVRTGAKTDVILEPQLITIKGGEATILDTADTIFRTLAAHLAITDNGDVSYPGATNGLTTVANTADTITITSGSLTVDGALSTTNRIAKLTVKGTASKRAKVSLAGVNTATAATLPIAMELVNADATFNLATTVVPTAYLPLVSGNTVSATTSTINSRGDTAVTGFTATTLQPGEGLTFNQAVTFTGALTLAGGTAEFGGGLTTAVATLLDLGSKLTVAGTFTPGGGITLSGGSVVEVTGTVNVAAAQTLAINDAASKFKGPDGRGGAIIHGNSVALTIETNAEADLRALFELPATWTAPSSAPFTHTVTNPLRAVWNGSKWGLPQ